MPKRAKSDHPPAPKLPPIMQRLRELGIPSYEKGHDYLLTKGVQVSGAYLSMLDRRKREPRLPMLRDIARALEIRAEVLVDLSGTMGNE